MSRLSFGIKTAQMNTTYPAIAEVWRAADQLPVFEHAWLFDHFVPIFADIDGPCLEGWTLLAALAAQTSRIRMGLMVAGNTYRHPAVLAQMVATIDIIANGRLDLGLGAGWNVYEHESINIPLYAPGERIRRLGEACEVIKRLFTEPLANFEGRYYQLRDARCAPKPVQQPYPPFVIGGSGEQLTLRVAAQYANVWNYVGGSTEIFVHKVRVLHEHCAAIGRDPAAIALSVQVLANYDDLAETADTLQSYVDCGASHLIINLRAPYPAGIVARLADEVVAKVRG